MLVYTTTMRLSALLSLSALPDWKRRFVIFSLGCISLCLILLGAVLHSRQSSPLPVRLTIAETIELEPPPVAPEPVADEAAPKPEPQPAVTAAQETVNPPPRPPTPTVSPPQPAPQPAEIESTPRLTSPIPEPAGPIPEPEPQPPAVDIDARYPHISAEIKQLARNLDLTGYAKQVFYDHNPRIFDNAQELETDCANSLGNVQRVLYGCWSRHKINLLRAPYMEITAAHELLHALYYDNYRTHLDRQLIDQLDEVIALYPQEIQRILHIYQDHYRNIDINYQEWAYYNEIYAFIGSQFAAIPQELEDHYAGFFNDRQKVVSYYHQWQISNQQKELAASNVQADYDRQVDEYVRCLYWENDEAVCQNWNPQGVFDGFVDCLNSSQAKWDDCLAIKPPFKPYTP